MSISVSVDTSKLDEIIAKVPGNRDKIVRESAVHILRNARAKAPYRTGFLRDNSDVVTGSGYTNIEFYAEYAGYVELGTRRMYARPFLRTAVETERQLFIAKLKEGMIES